MGKSGTLSIRIVGDTKPLSKSLDSGLKKVGRFAAGVAKIGAAVGTATAAGSVAVLKMGATLEDMDKKAAAVFEGQLPAVKEWAKANAGAMGLTSTELAGLTANFADLLKPMGFTAEQAADMAKETNELSGALAKWSGGQRSAAEVSDILAKAMLGERDGLKSLGISITEADVKARLAANGTDELTGAALEQAKAIATQQLIMEKSTDAQAAWGAGQDDLSVKINRVQAWVKELRDNAIRTLLPLVVSAAEAMGRWGQQIAADLQPRIEALGAWWNQNGPTIIAHAKAVADTVQKTLATAFRAASNAFAFVSRNSEVMIPLLGAILAGFVAFKAVVTITKSITAVTKAWAAAQVALNLVLTANPIGLVIAAVAALVAGIVIAYKRSETFRAIVDGAFRAVAGAAEAVVGWFVSVGTTAVELYRTARTNFDLLVGFVRGLPGRIAAAARGMWDSVFEGFRAMVNNVIRGWNNLSFRIPAIDVPGPFNFEGATVGTPNIPYLADGGIVTKPTLAMIGEAGPEAVVPLSRGGGMAGAVEVHNHIQPGAVQISGAGDSWELNRMVEEGFERLAARIAVEVSAGAGAA